METEENPDTQSRPKRATVNVAWRFEQRAHEVLCRMAAAAEVTPRTWLEQEVLRLDNPHVVVRRNEHPDLRPLIFQISRAGNNLNQLAHKFNALDQAGQLDGSQFQEAMERLEVVSALLRKALVHAGAN